METDYKKTEYSVTVLAPSGEQLNPCRPARARILLKKGKAKVMSTEPFMIQLIGQFLPTSAGKTKEEE